MALAASKAEGLALAGGTRPNILVFLTDDHGQWAQHAYGDAELVTPNMDRLAMRGTRMTRSVHHLSGLFSGQGVFLHRADAFAAWHS